jgi:hypothetical protein
MDYTIHDNKIYRIIEEESREFRSTPAISLQQGEPPSPAGEKLKEPVRYTRVLDKPDRRLFYRVGTKFSEQTFIQVNAKSSEVEGRVAPLSIVMGGVVDAVPDSSLMCVEFEERSLVAERRERLFVPLLRNPADSRAWRIYLKWASEPENWTPQAVALNYSKDARNAASRLNLSAPLGESGFMLQADYAAQVVRENGKTMALCKFVPVCASGLMSSTWYFGLREAIYLLTIMKKILKENSAPRLPKDFQPIVRIREPMMDMLAHV